MAQPVRAPTALPEALIEFNSQQPHGDSQPSVMRYDARVWCAYI